MPSDPFLESDIEELKKPDPKYADPATMARHAVPFEKRIAELEDIVFLRPGDPWILYNDRVIRLPFPPEGNGITMMVCALPLVRLFGGRLVFRPSDGQWVPCRGDGCLTDDDVGSDAGSMDGGGPDAGSVRLPVHEILNRLRLGILIAGDGSAYIGDRMELARIGPPDLDDDYRLILHPFSDEGLFVGKMVTDEWGFQRNRYSRELAIRSLAFSKASYNMHIKPFIMDGWLDYTLIHEGKIRATEDDWNSQPSAARQFVSTVRQIVASQSAKAVVMGRPTSDGRAVINITFTGTKHAPDWLNNIKVGVSNRLHRGFYELASQFDTVMNKIRLDRLAAVLGLEKLTLPDIIAEARKPDSRYKLWITGHSQGGALTQVYIAEFLIARGVLPSHIFGYSFASPSVATTEYCADPGDFPVYNILNDDDFAGRVGSAVRLGVDLHYVPDRDFREANYAGYREPRTKAEFDDILKLCYWMTDSFKFGEYMIAMTTFATEYPVAKSILEWIGETPVLRKLYAAFRDKADIPQAIHDRMYGMLRKPYMDVGGTPPSEEHILKVRAFLETLYRKWGSECLMDYMFETHKIPSNYSEIVLLPEERFMRAVWTSGKPSRLVTGSGEQLQAPVPFPEIDPRYDPEK